MAFDEQLRRAFDTLSDHLRDEMGRQAAALAAELTASLAADREQALAALRAERDAAIAAATRAREGAVAAATREHEAALENARREAAAAARDAAERDISTRIANATAVAEARAREQADADAQARIAALDAAVQEAEARARAAHEASRDAAERAAAAASLPANQPVGDGLTRIAAAVRAIDRETSLKGILTALADHAAREAPRSAVLLLERGQFRMWRAAGFPASEPTPFGFTDAGLLGDAARQMRPVVSAGRAGEMPSFSALASGSAAAVPIVIGGETVAVLYADHAGAAAEAGWIEPIELLVRHAASTLEAVTAFKVARALVANPEPPVAPNEEADEHEAARRYARLLVSEIKLYHEPDVLAGRRERDLATRLAGQIERARTLYFERVPAAVRGSTDYFNAELVRTLASGDPLLLGEPKA